jgi:hypothetical protein
VVRPHRRGGRGAGIAARRDGAGARRIGGRGRALLAAGPPAAAVGVLAVGFVDIRIWTDDDPGRLGARLFHELSWEVWVSPTTPGTIAGTVALFVAVAVLAFRSAIWLVAAAAVGLAVAGVFALEAHAAEFPRFGLPREAGTVTEAAAVASGLLAVAAFALIRERFAARPERSAPAS